MAAKDKEKSEKSLSLELLPLCSKVIWQRGEEYADEGLVGDIWRERLKIIAHVFGTRRYLVKLSLKGRITGQCTCEYAAGGEICKHIAATAIAFDELRGLKRPEPAVVEELAKEHLAKSFSWQLQALFTDPLGADLQPLCTYTDFGKWVRPHAKLPPRPAMVTDAGYPLKVVEVKRVFVKIKAWEDRYNFDPYFCAGEVTAAVCEVLRIIFDRLEKTDLKEALAVFVAALTFYFQDYLEMIDGSDGVWKVAETHLTHLARILRKRGMNKESLLPFENQILEATDGWEINLTDIAKGNFLGTNG